MSSEENNTDLPENLDEAKGRAKQAAGKLIGDQDLENEGKQDETVGQVKSTIDGISDKAKETVDEIEQKLDGDE